jgi:hypothetical protein
VPLRANRVKSNHSTGSLAWWRHLVEIKKGRHGTPATRAAESRFHAELLAGDSEDLAWLSEP